MIARRSNCFRRVLLVNPPNTMPKDSTRRISEPLGLLYMGAMLKKHGYEVDVYDKEKSKSEINLKFVFDSQGKVYNMIILALHTVAFLLPNFIHVVFSQKL